MRRQSDETKPVRSTALRINGKAPNETVVKATGTQKRKSNLVFDAGHHLYYTWF